MKLTILILILNFVGIFSLSCFPCDKSKCTNIAAECKWGVGPDICHCCERCLKGEGEPCGGIWHLDGQCAEGLECEPLDNSQDYYGAYLPRGKCVSA